MRRNVCAGISKPKTHDPSREDTNFFSEFASVETFELPESMPDMEQIVSIITEPEVISMKVVKGVEGISCEGVRLTGKMAVVYVRLRQKILYAASLLEQTIYTVENETFHNIYVVVPPKIKGTDPETLIKHKHLRPKVTIEDAVVKKINSRFIFKNISLLVSLYIVPSYEICYSLHREPDLSSICLCMGKGGNSICISPEDHDKSIRPAWSPTGQEIAFLSGTGGEYMLYVYSLQNSLSRRVTGPEEFRAIGSFCWTKDGNHIVFSAPAGRQRELFSIDLHNLKARQLTYGNAGVNSYKPKQSPESGRIGFLKSISGITYLYTMNADGLDVKMASSSTGVKDFNWSRDGRFMAFIKSRNGKSDELWLIDTVKGDEELLPTLESIVEIDRVEFSSEGSSIAFTGSDCHTEDVFVHDIHKGKTINITGSFKGSRISSFAWNADSDRIYYSSNELFYYNIYSVLLRSGEKHQITNSTGSHITLGCRPGIR